MTIKVCVFFIKIIFDKFKMLPFTTDITLPNQNIPSGIYSALEDSSQIESILLSYNDVNLRWVSKLNWTYTLTFNGK